MTELKLDPRNARRHSVKNKRQIKQSLETVGAGRSILADADGIVRAGNGVFAEWGDKPIKIVETDGKELVVVQRTDLRGQDAIRAAALDNLVADSSAFDYDAAILAEIARDDDVIRAIANEDAKLRELLRKENGNGEKQDPGELIDKAAQLQEKWQVKRGEVWQVGKHRLMCGDSTSKEDVERLMDGKRAQLFATDPPYGADAGNIGFTAQRDELEAITNDDLKDTAMQGWLEKVFGTWKERLEPAAAWYLWHPMLTQGYFAAAAAAAAAAVIIHRQIIWIKEQFIFGRGDYHWQHELCFYGWVQGHRPPFYGERNQTTVWSIPYGERRSKIGHPTAKPPELWFAPMQNHTLSSDICAEPFAGSGAQLVAGEMQGRTVYAMELLEKYCAVSLERLANLGLQPQRLSDG